MSQFEKLNWGEQMLDDCGEKGMAVCLPILRGDIAFEGFVVAKAKGKTGAVQGQCIGLSQIVCLLSSKVGSFEQVRSHGVGRIRQVG
ncbi:hypothetical protein D3C75_1119730 [compost metagenome]